jgi:hypothetical protein
MNYLDSHTILRLVAMTLAVAVHQTCAAGIITSSTNPSNGNTYYLLTENTWTASQLEAVSLGGNLVTINDQAENDWVFNTFSSFGGETRSLWIGLNDAVSEGTFEWINGEPIGYLNWAAPEPNNFLGNEDYAHFYTSNYGNAWNDAQDTGTDIADRIYGVVEIVTPVPEPSSIVLVTTAVAASVGYGRRRHRVLLQA